jgi:hypothetical protein
VRERERTSGALTGNAGPSRRSPCSPCGRPLADPALLGDALPGESWSSRRKLLIASVGEELTAAERETFKALAGREREPGEMVEVFLCVAGRRSGSRGC